MDNILGVICAFATGAGLMYLYLLTAGRLRRYEYEQELQQQITRLKKVEREYLDDLKQRCREEEKWTPKENVVLDKRLSDLMSKSLADAIKKTD